MPDTNSAIPPRQESLDTAQAQSAATERPSVGQARSGNNKGGGLCFRFTISLLVLVLIAAVGGGGYLGYFFGYLEIERLKARQEQIGSDVEAVSRAREELQDMLAVNARLQENSQTIQAQSGEILSAMARTEELAASVSRRLESYESRDPNDWFIANAFLMLSQAQQHVIYDRQLESALYKIRFADKLLEHINRPEIVELRRIIALDLHTLESQPHIDYAGIAFALDAVYGSIDRLSMSGVRLESSGGDTATAESWSANLLHSAEEFSRRFVEIRRKEAAAIDEVLNPEFAAMIREQAKLRISLAKSYLMGHDITAFKSNLESVRESLECHFDRNDPAQQAAVAKISELSGADITYNVSNGLESYAAVEKLFRNGAGRVGLQGDEQ